MNFLLAFAASAVYIFLKAAQQLHVVNFEYGRILPTSLGMAACEVFILVNVVRSSDSVVGLAILAVCIGLGAGLGCVTAMRAHERRKHAPD